MTPQLTVPQLEQLGEKFDRVIGAYPFGIWVVSGDRSREIARALLKAGPGSILCLEEQDRDCISLLPVGECGALGCIAGWISEDDTP